MSGLVRHRPLGGFIDELVQKFENCRAGLPEGLAPEVVTKYFDDLYEQERPRLGEAVRLLESMLSPEAVSVQFAEIDALLRKTLLPAYSRVAREMTTRERNDFYVARPGFHGLERAAWTVGGILVGGFVVWAPFIPIWSKEVVLPFAIGGLLAPELRRWFMFRRYGRDVNRLVARIEAEVSRVQSAYLESDDLPRPLPLPRRETEG